MLFYLLALVAGLLTVYYALSSPKKNIAGKLVFVTGGGNGLGKELVQAFYNKGCKVAWCDLPHFAPKGNSLN